MTIDHQHLKASINVALIGMLDALDHLAAIANCEATRDAIAVEQKRLGQIVPRAQLILSFLAAQPPLPAKPQPEYPHLRIIK